MEPVLLITLPARVRTIVSTSGIESQGTLLQSLPAIDRIEPTFSQTGKQMALKRRSVGCTILLTPVPRLAQSPLGK
jgi:hypothetical protein